TEQDTFVFEAPVSPTEYLTWFRDFYGPTMNAFEAAAANGKADELFSELDALFNAQNTSGDRNVTAIPATFLCVDVTI
ncbi:MAG TPA: methyltransferase type 11, partial [Acidimicrobiia bacterium]|nr:methyltransferase type 11 [Acidimicrobiia bacterium]